MARPIRLQFPGALYHALSRGNAKQCIFADGLDRSRFLRILERTVERYRVICHAFCLMDNHYHLLIETPEGNLSQGMQHLNSVYSQSFNRRHERVGHVLQGRFKAILVDKDSYLLEVCRYIALNPVRAGFVSMPAAWPWSSYRAQAGLSPPPRFLTVDWILDCFDESDRIRAQQRFRQFVLRGLAEDGRIERVLDEVLFVGSNAYVSTLREAISCRTPPSERRKANPGTTRPALAELFGGCNSKVDRDARICEALLDHRYRTSEVAAHLNVHRSTILRIVRRGQMQQLGV